MKSQRPAALADMLTIMAVGNGGVHARVGRVPPVQPQPVLAPLTPAAIFLVVTINEGGEATEHDALPDLESTRRWTQRHHVGDDLVTHHLGKRAERRQRVVGVALAEVEQDLLGVRPANAGQTRTGDHPIVVQRPRIGHVAQRDGRLGQIPGEHVGVIGHDKRLGRHAENQSPHHGVARSMAAAPEM